MGSFANLSANLNLNIQNFSSQLRAASNQANTFAANLNGRTVQSMRELNKHTIAWGLNMKSVSRVVSGIIISQAFYTMLQNIRQATSAVWEFAQQLEYAQIAYSNLFGDTQLALEFINVLKDFAALTPFGFTEAEKSAKRLLAYGIEYKNVMYVMQGVLTASAAQGDSMKIEQISRALGQIYTYGKLMTAEVRQLTEAGIPVYEILQEKLGLTQDQLRNLGRESIPASVAINALVDGINDRFGNVLEAASKTLQGIISNIKDNATMLFAGIFEPITVMTKSALFEVGQFFFNMRELFETAGTGGVFERLFPPELHDTLRLFVANIQAAIESTIRFVYVLGSMLKPVLLALVAAYNALSPALIAIQSAILAVTYMITSNATAMRALTVAIAAAAAMWTVFKVRALATAVVTAVIHAISKALAGLAAVLTFVMKHPFWTMLIGIAGLVVGLSVGFGNLSNKVNSFFKSLTQFNGVDADKILLPSQKERANDLDKFNNKLEGTSEAMDDLADSTGKATKAAKGLLSFDEVFKLNTPDEGTGSGIGSALEDLEDIPLGGGLGDAFITEIPDFTEYINSITEGFIKPFKAAWEKIKENISKIASVAIGAGLGAAIGLILGGPIGAKIGAIIGGLAGGVWSIIAEKLGIAPTQQLATVISGVISGAFIAAVKIVKGMTKGLVATFTNGVFSGFSRMVGFSFKTTLTKALKAGVIGAIASIGTGLLTNALTAWIAEEFKLTESDLANAGVGQTIGSIIGTITGMILGGPIGSIVGGVFGQLAGSIVGEFWNYLNATLKGSILGGVAGLPIGALIGTLVGSVGGPLGAALGAAIGAAIGAAVGYVADHWDSIVEFFKNFVKKVEETVTVVAKYVDAVVEFFGYLRDYISEILNGIFTVINTVWNDIYTAISTVLTDINTAINTVWTDISNAVVTVLSDIWSAISTVWNDIFSVISNILNSVWNVVTNIWNSIYSLISSVLNNVKSIVTSIWNSIKAFISSILTAIYNSIVQYFGWIFTTISEWLTQAYDKVQSVFTNIYNAIRTYISSAFEFVAYVFPLMYNAIKISVSDAYTEVKTFFGEMYTTMKNKISDMYDTVKKGVKNLYNEFKSFVDDLWSNVFKKFFGWIEDAIDKLKDFFRLQSKVGSSSSSGASLGGHATGGIFDREHIARFAEGNKAEAVIPLENASAMQPFVDAISRGIIEGIAPSLMSLAPATSSVYGSSLPPMYVGTLIADDRGLKQLYKKFELIQVQENARKGLT